MSNRNRKMPLPWDKSKDAPHSPPGIEELKKNAKDGLRSLYAGIAQVMFEYRGIDKEPMFADALEMSRDTIPEKLYYRNGESVVFKIGDELHNLPVAYNGGINIYGYMSNWHPVPVGWDDTKRGEYPSTITDIFDMKLDSSNSVILRNDLFGNPDMIYVDTMIDELVDNILTLNQLQLLASVPYVFNVTEDNVMSAKNYFLAVAEHRAVIFTNALGEKVLPTVERTDVKIDPSVFELFDRWECMILEYLGYPCVPITKRAQQTVSEVQSNDDKISARRREKLQQRQRDWDRVNKMFGTNIQVVSVIDEWAKEQADEQEDIGGGDDAAE